MQAILVFAAVVFATMTLGLYACGRYKAGLISGVAALLNAAAYLVLKNMGLG